MRKIVSVLWLSLDGVVEAPERWAFGYSNDEVMQANQSGMGNSDAMLLGRKTYEIFANFWPHQPSDAPMAEYINSTRKYVVSTTLDSVDWQNSHLIRGDVAEGLRDLKRQPGKAITVVGSPTLVKSLLGDGLLDALHLQIPPLLVGSGKRLFADGEQQPLRLVDSQTFSNGVLNLTYQPEEAAAGTSAP